MSFPFLMSLCIFKLKVSAHLTPTFYFNVENSARNAKFGFSKDDLSNKRKG
jgi:hypothetical protein